MVEILVLANNDDKVILIAFNVLLFTTFPLTFAIVPFVDIKLAVLVLVETKESTFKLPLNIILLPVAFDKPILPKVVFITIKFEVVILDDAIFTAFNALILEDDAVILIEFPLLAYTFPVVIVVVITEADVILFILTLAPLIFVILISPIVNVFAEIIPLVTLVLANNVLVVILFETFNDPEISNL